ncbi:winged helix-turn-helix transcriptional regulator [Acuticoccus kandeliae]|uniref:winged helix-turn-helix transcriptional regulator n=1 Tax=Acuticoccus kandeliae TaxID=2073160 RepID=UPI000D3EA168
MATEHSHDACRSVRDLLARIGSKWTVVVVRSLRSEPRRFSELKRDIGDISQKMLTSTLRDLERDGFICRKVTASIPPRVDYALTDLGRDLLGPLDSLGDWAVANQHRVDAARARAIAAE